MNAQRQAAIVAGLAYLLSIAIVVSAQFGVHQRLNVPGNAVATAHNILAHERLFRFAIVCDFTYAIAQVALYAALYVLLATVSRGLALVSTLWKLIYAVVWLVMSLSFFDALRLMHGAPYLRVFETDRLQALAKLATAGSGDRYYAALLFYSLGATVASYLWLKSKYIAKSFAIAGVIACAFCVVCTFIFLIVPSFANFVNLWWFDSPMAVFEIALSIWLLFTKKTWSVRHA